jgi:capsular polysaccharide biosynthesis protein
LIGLLEFCRRSYARIYLRCADIPSKSEQRRLEEVEKDLYCAGCSVYEPPRLLSQSVSFAHYHDAYLIGYPPIGISSDGSIIRDTIFRTDARTFAAISSLHIKAQREIIRLKRGKPLNTAVINMQTCSLLSAWNHFGHFIPEHLLKVYYIQKEFDVNDIQYVIEPQTPQWKKQLLGLAGINEKNILEWTGQSLKFKKLIVPDYPEISQEGFNWINSLFPATSMANPILKLYLSRQNFSSRYIINATEVEKELVSEGFDIVVPEELSLHEQVTLFRSARVIAGPNGSAFTNQIFMSPGSHILEFFGSNRVHYFNRQVAKVRGHKHYALLDSRTGSFTKDNGVLVDIVQLKRLLLQIENEIY